ncbi:metallopeptidase family M24-domain-containing protein [Xylariomycetidae sp. FL2044]|nr:metallopeptidase family M24-domain-containing protein [Xylariomycetidae sp. FL2044]
MDHTSIDHSFLAVDEFDALSIEVGEDETDELGAPRRYPAISHARKVAKGLSTQNGIIYLPGQREATWEDSDQGPPFRQRRYFYYMSGANFPGCSVTYDIAADKLTLWIPYTPPATILWFGNTPSAADCLARSDVHEVKYVSELPTYLSSILSTAKTLYALRASQLPKFDGFEKMKHKITIDIATLQPVIDEARVIKSDYEVAMIRKANAVSSAAHRDVITRTYQKGVLRNECQIESIFLAACLAKNAHAQAYPVIAGSGPNASTLHYEANNESLVGRQVLLLDAGCEWECYASDITRTMPIQGLPGTKSTFSPQAKAIYDLVHQMQDECIHKIRPGVVFRDLQLHATLVAVRGLLRLGILHNGTASEIFKNGTGAAFFPHGLGHHVGLDVHDVLSRDLLRPAGEGMWGKRRPVGPQSVRAMIKQAATEPVPAANHGVLAPNMVVTVEPGVYFCRPYIEAYFLRNDEHKKYLNVDVLDQYWDVGGVRIEDCILVTEDGHENLTTAPKGYELLKLMGMD